MMNNLIGRYKPQSIITSFYDINYMTSIAIYGYMDKILGILNQMN